MANTLGKLAIILISCMLLPGCLPSTPEIDYRVGTEGLVLSIIGPEEIMLYDDEAQYFEDYEIKIENKGATTIGGSGSASTTEGIYMRIQLSEFLSEKDSGKKQISLNSLSEISPSPLTELDGKTMYSNEGWDVSYFLPIKATAPPNRGVDASIKVDLCYRYKTILSSTVCVNTKKQKEGEGCKTKEYSFYGGQGGPIAITKVEVRETTEQDGKVNPRVILTVENRGDDIVSLPEGDDFKQACLASQNINKLKMNAVKLGTRDMTCDVTDNQIDISDDDEKVVVCTYSGDMGTAPLGYIDSLLYVELEYGYHASESKDLSIVRKDLN